MKEECLMIDWNRVNTLKEEVGAEDFDEIIALFLEEVDASVEKLQDAPDPATLGEDLHFIKGSAAGLGFSAFVEQCHTGEILCRKGQADQVNVAAILEAYSASKIQFLAELPKSPDS